MTMNIKLLSYNIQSWDLTERRIKGVIDLIKRHNPDIICFQEVTVKWFSILIKEFSDVYSFCGKDRHHGEKDVETWKKERNCVLYKKDIFTKLYSHTYWYGDDLNHPCLTEGAEHKRVFTCVGLKGKDDKVFEVINTHFEHSNPKSREIQANILVNYIEKNRHTVVLAGDFNSNPSEEAYRLVSKTLIDIGKEFKEEEITYHAYGSDKVERIDYIFRSSGVHSNNFRLIKDEYEGLPPSDHYPVECIFEI